MVGQLGMSEQQVLELRVAELDLTLRCLERVVIDLSLDLKKSAEERNDAVDKMQAAERKVDAMRGMLG